MRDTMDSVDTGVMNAAFTAFLQQIETELAQLHAGTAVMTKAEYDPAGLSLDAAVQLYSCTKSGKVYALKGSGAVGRFKVPAAWSAGDTWTVNGVAVPAYCGADAADGDCVLCVKTGIRQLDSLCRSFKYDPLKRVPKKNIGIGSFTEEDFKL